MALAAAVFTPDNVNNGLCEVLQLLTLFPEPLFWQLPAQRVGLLWNQVPLERGEPEVYVVATGIAVSVLSQPFHPLHCLLVPGLVSLHLVPEPFHNPFYVVLPRECPRFWIDPPRVGHVEALGGRGWNAEGKSERGK